MRDSFQFVPMRSGGMDDFMADFYAGGPDWTPSEDNRTTTTYHYRSGELPDQNPGVTGEYSYQSTPPTHKKRHGKAIALVSILLILGFGTATALGVVLAGKLQNSADSSGGSTSVSEHLTISDTPSGSISSLGLTTKQIAAKALPSVIGINVYAANQVQPIGEASGIIMDTNGYIITNAHVVSDASDVTVIFEDGSEVSAKIIGMDTRTDLAVIKVNPKGIEDLLVPAEFGDSDALALGEDVVAIGNAGGYYNSVTRGVISGLNREVSTSVSINLIQTDAAINPGNSGGALLNCYGQVIGINSSKLTGSEIDSMGFAIPISDAKPIIDQLISNGAVTDRVQLGVTIVALNSTTGQMYGLPSQGLYISQISELSNLYKAGITRGDVLLEADGTSLVENNDLIRLLEKTKPGQEMTFLVSKSNGQEETVTVVLQAADAFTSTEAQRQG